jgi:hypothetical protein
MRPTTPQPFVEQRRFRRVQERQFPLIEGAVRLIAHFRANDSGITTERLASIASQPSLRANARTGTLAQWSIRRCYKTPSRTTVRAPRFQSDDGGRVSRVSHRGVLGERRSGYSPILNQFFSGRGAFGVAPIQRTG